MPSVNALAAVSRLRIAGVLIACGVLLYVGLLSINYDLNGIQEVETIEKGGTGLFSANHMLHRPVVWTGYTLMRAVGYSGRALLSAQVTTALFGAFGLARGHVYRVDIRHSHR